MRNRDQWEEFCCVKVILHVPHRSIQGLTGDNTISWSTLFSQHIEEINNDPNDLLGHPVDNEEEDVTDDDDQEPSEDEQEEYRYDWMRLAEMGPTRNIDSSVDLGTRDVDRNHDWINDGRQYYSVNNLAGVNNFIQQASDEDRNYGNRSECNDFVDHQTLNENQKSVFKRIETHYSDILAGKQVEALRMIIMGTAGTGKSYLIRAIRGRLRTMAGSGSKSPVVVLAPTGVAAFNINGVTIHSMLSIPIINDKKRFDIDGERLNQLQERLDKVQYIIIDEKSMVGRRMLALIDMRLRQAFPENKDEPFGGRSIIFFSDFGQLPPVLDLPMYTNDISRDTFSNNGAASYKHFSEAYKLNIV